MTDCTRLTSIKIPNSVTSIGSRAFRKCTSLTSVTIPDSVTTIAISTFSGCTSLTSVTISDSVTSIEDNAFFDCTSLTSITILDSVISIGDEAFAYCESLIDVTIGNGITKVGDGVFYRCYKLPQDVQNYISQFQSNADDDDEYDGEMSFEEWYNSSECEADGEEFVETLKSLVKSNYNVDEFFEEPSIQGYQGRDYIWITLSDGSRYEFKFDWSSEQSTIYSDGPEAAAEYYFQEIQDGIDSGSALVN